MANLENITPQYTGNGYLAMDATGNVVISEGLQSEILSRLKSQVNTFPFDLTYGSRLYDVLNSKQMSVGVVSSWIRTALRPMVQSGRIKDNIIVKPVFLGNQALIGITTTNSEGVTTTLKVNTLLLA